MKTLTKFTICFLCFSFGITSVSLGQQTMLSTSGQQRRTALAKSSLKKIGFRVIDWKTIHSKDEDETKETIAALKKVGCEVISESHGDHIDVKYRCSDWKSLSFATDQLVNQWSTWLSAKGMETVILNPPAATKNATVKFRMLEPKTVHLHKPEDAKKIINTLRLVGCSVETAEHNGHQDCTFSCPQWTTIELQSCDSAHSWQKWLDDSGFETQHSHAKE